MPLASNDVPAFSNYLSLSRGATETVRVQMVQCFPLHIIGAALMDAALFYKICLVLGFTQLAQLSRGNRISKADHLNPKC